MRKIEHKSNGKEYVKYCKKCDKWLSLNCFGENKRAWDGLNLQCKECRNITTSLTELTAEEWKKINKLGLNKEFSGGLKR